MEKDKDKKQKKPPPIENSIYDCTLIIQKIEEWQSILEEARKESSGIKENQLITLQKKIGAITNIIYGVHGTAKYSDEVVSKLYYSNLNAIEELKRYYEVWENTKAENIGNIKGFIENDPRAKELLETFPRDQHEELEDIANYIFHDGSSNIAIYFTAIETELSEDHTKKKIKKIYKF